MHALAAGAEPEDRSGSAEEGQARRIGTTPPGQSEATLLRRPNAGAIEMTRDSQAAHSPLAPLIHSRTVAPVDFGASRLEPPKSFLHLPAVRPLLTLALVWLALLHFERAWAAFVAHMDAVTSHLEPDYSQRIVGTTFVPTVKEPLPVVTLPMYGPYTLDVNTSMVPANNTLGRDAIVFGERPDCYWVGGFVLAIGIACLHLLCLVHLLPYCADRARLSTTSSSMLQSLRSSWTAARVLLLLLGFAAFLSVLSSQCWHDQDLREWAMMDLVVLVMVLAGVAAYDRWHASWASLTRSPSWSVRFRRHRRLYLLAVAVSMLALSHVTRLTYESSRLHQYTWRIADRPAACRVSCHAQLYHRSPRSRACTNGLGATIAPEYCLENLPPSAMLSSHDPLFEPCPTQVCRHPNGATARFYWVLRDERIIGGGGAGSFHSLGNQPRLSGRCSRHDQRTVEHVQLAQHWSCWDDWQGFYVDGGSCKAKPPPKAPMPSERGAPVDTHHGLAIHTPHCSNRCHEVAAFAARVDAFWFGVLLVCAGTIAARWFQGRPWNTYDAVAQWRAAMAAEGAALLNRPAEPPAGMADASDLHHAAYFAHLRRVHARQTEHRGWLLQSLLYLRAVLVSGPLFLPRWCRVMLEWPVAPLALYASARTCAWLVWFVDATCTEYLPWMGAHAILTTGASIAVALWLIHRWQATDVAPNRRQEGATDDREERQDEAADHPTATRTMGERTTVF